MRFKNVNLKDPKESFLIWLGEVKLPRSNYLNKKIRGKLLLNVKFENLEYIAFKCNGCSDLLKKQAKYLYFIQLYENLSEYDITEDEYDSLVEEYIEGGIKDEQ